MVGAHVLVKKDPALRTPADRLWVVLLRLIHPKRLGRPQEIL
jgi:hypothetical protein